MKRKRQGKRRQIAKSVSEERGANESAKEKRGLVLAGWRPESSVRMGNNREHNESTGKDRDRGRSKDCDCRVGAQR